MHVMRVWTRAGVSFLRKYLAWEPWLGWEEVQSWEKTLQVAWRDRKCPLLRMEHEFMPWVRSFLVKIISACSFTKKRVGLQLSNANSIKIC